MTPIRMVTLATGCLAASLALGGPAQAATIVGGETQVTVTANLPGLGLNAQPFGTATADGATFTFPITGGTAGADGATIAHEGSGVTLFTGDAPDADDSIAATVGNFLIDTMAAAVFGDVVGGPDELQNLELFIFSPDDDDFSDGIDLDISDTLGGLLADVFGAPTLNGAQFGVASTSPDVAPVPLPAGGWLLLGGLGALGVVRRRRKAA